MRLILLVTMLALTPLDHALAAPGRAWNTPLIETVDDRDSIPDDNVTALAEDRDGFLWVGSTNGLLRYDGYRFRRFVSRADNPQSISGGFVRSLLSASDGRLWIGTNADGVSMLEPGTFEFRRFRHDADSAATLSSDGIRALAEAADGSIWIGTLNGLNRWEPASQTMQRYSARSDGQAGPVDDRILALTSDAAGNLWVGSWVGLDVLRAGDTRFTRVRPRGLAADELQGQQVRSIVAAADGRIWIGTLAGALLIVDPDTLEVTRAVDHLTQTAGAGFVLLCAASVDGRELWLGGLGGIRVVDALARRERMQMQNDPAVPSGLGTSDVRALLLDRAGQLWMGGYGGGLQRFNTRNRAISMLRHRAGQPDSLGSPSISSVIEHSDGRLLVGTRGNGVDLLDHDLGVVDRLTPQHQGLHNGVVTALAQSRDGTLWIGTDQGLNRSDFPRGHSVIPVTEPDLRSNTIRRLMVGSSGQVWVGTNAGLVRLDGAGGSGTRVVGMDGEPVVVEINAIAQANDGRLWIGAANGLYTMASAAAPLMRIEAGHEGANALNHNTVVGLLIDHRGQLWVDTAQGLNRLLDWDGVHARFEDVSARLGLSGQPFGANLLEDARGRIWTHRFVHDPTTGDVSELLRADGADLGTGWFRSYMRASDGSLYFGGTRGLMRIEPDYYERWNYSPHMAISELRVGGEDVPFASDALVVQVPARRQDLSVEFVALDFSAPLRNRYAYQLEGVDEHWIETDASRRIAAYSNLWPGQYTLHMRGTNRAGQWSQRPLAVTISVQPKFWQTTWFLLLATLLLAGAAYGLARLYSSSLIRRAKTLEHVVKQRTGELFASKERAEQALSDLTQAQRQLVDAEKMAALGQLVAGVAHEINTPLGVAMTAASMMSEHIDVLNEKFTSGVLRKSEISSFIATAGEASLLVDKNLAKAAHLVQTFKQVSADRTSDVQRRFDLAEYLEAVFESLAPGLTRRNVTHVLHCDSGVMLDSYPGSLGQIVTSLTQNALMHAFDDGVAGSIVVRCTQASKGQVLIEFSDNGKGIAPEAMPHVFEPFFTTARAHGCTGLGLHIAFNQVTGKLGGTLTVDSAQRHGCTFRLLLPTNVGIGAVPKSAEARIETLPANTAQSDV